MTTQPLPPWKASPFSTTGPHDAGSGTPMYALGGRKAVARKGVRSASPSDQQAGDGRYPVAWLHISAPPRAVPTATSKCRCGWDRSAVGHRRVLALIDDHTAHRDTCPLRTRQEGRAAA